MVELRYYRRLGHAQHDPQDYVDPDELAMWEDRDPIDLFEHRILEEDWATESVLHKIRRRSEEECRLAAEQAGQEPGPDGREAVKGIYTDTITQHPWTRVDGPNKSDSSELNR